MISINYKSHITSDILIKKIVKTFSRFPEHFAEVGFDRRDLIRSNAKLSTIVDIPIVDQAVNFSQNQYIICYFAHFCPAIP